MGRIVWPVVLLQMERHDSTVEVGGSFSASDREDECAKTHLHFEAENT